MELTGRKALVLGLGETGVSVAQWLARAGARVRVADSRATPPGFEALCRAAQSVDLITGPFTDALTEDIDLIAISPGLALAEPVVQRAIARGVPVVGDIELFAWALKASRPELVAPRVIGITGTNGKSTVTALAGAMLAGAGVDCEVAGNISPAALAALIKRVDAGRMPAAWVLELSSFQLETTQTLACDAATVLNLTEDHLDRYAGMREYAAAKARIFQGEGAQVLNRDDAWSRGMAIAGRRQITFGLDRPAPGHYGLIEQSGEYWLARGAEPLLPRSDLKLAGLHNAANALACLALCEAVGVEPARMLPALRAFRGLPHRVEPVGEIEGVAFYDDSKGTNVGSTVAALDGLVKQLAPKGGRVILIAGGEGKGQDFAPLAPSVKRAARAVVLIGRDAPLIEAAIADARIEILRAGSMEEAVERGYRAARAGDVVLLSPACASFDMFRNYKHRGEVFAAAVKAMGHARAH